MKFKSFYKSTFKIYTQPQIAKMIVLGFAAGLPFLLTLSVLDIWLKRSGLSNTNIGLFSLTHLPYTLKFLWAPLVDMVDIPYLSRKFGRKRSWGFLSQFLLITGLLGIAFSNPLVDLNRLIFFVSLTAFANGLHDVTLYAFQINRIDEKHFGPGASMVIIGWRLGTLAASGGGLYIAYYYGWFFTYFLAAIGILVGVGFIICNKEPDNHSTSEMIEIQNKVKDWEEKHNVHLTKGLKKFFLKFYSLIYECLILPMFLLFKHPKVTSILFILATYKIGDAMIIKMAKIFYIELGFNELEISKIVNVFGVMATILGGVIGGSWLQHTGIIRGMLHLGIIHLISNVCFIILYKTGYNITLLYVTIFVENITRGMMMTSFLAFLYKLCKKAYPITQYALLWGLYDILNTFYRSISGWMSDKFGWMTFFIVASILSLPSLLFLFRLVIEEKKDENLI